ncbi:DUF2500 domain-containing protein [Mesobacillus subterraneus]|uniref:DUF2500 domain-containing protein n=1 Tax=Mesobacillus subterraneus TaxID=285983 RepID=A0A3R9KY82_9BACI|nr:DUF2500 domain-containing protein [Mesobacillus subterraneus]RSD28782.1 DUF2500 domain-containing protein [Mesobacillus subterraneus]
MVEAPGDFMFTIGPIFMVVIFVIVFGMIIFSIIKGIGTWSSNNQAPRVNANARVVTKRTSIHGGGETHAHNSYYVTFEFDSGDRLELQVNGREYGQLVEGDHGELQFQGTRYLGFTRFCLGE